MGENKYALAGWLAITQAVIIPIAVFISIIQGIIMGKYLNYSGPTFGPSDVLMIVATLFGIYTLLMLKKLLNERYDFHKINTPIIIAIIWNVVFELVGLGIKLMFLFGGRDFDEMTVLIIFFSFMAVAMITAGIIDIFIGVRLLSAGESMSNMIRVYAYIAVIAGILEVTVFLSPFALLLLPVSLVTMGLIFLKDKEEVEFV